VLIEEFFDRAANVRVLRRGSAADGPASCLRVASEQGSLRRRTNHDLAAGTTSSDSGPRKFSRRNVGGFAPEDGRHPQPAIAVHEHPRHRDPLVGQTGGVARWIVTLYADRVDQVRECVRVQAPYSSACREVSTVGRTSPGAPCHCEQFKCAETITRDEFRRRVRRLSSGRQGCGDARTGR